MNRKTILLLIAAFAGFAAFSLWDARHPMAQRDENIMLINMRAMLGEGSHYVSGPVIRLPGDLPVVFFSPYHVGIEHVLYLPFVKVFGLNHVSVRVAGMFFSLLTLLFTFLFLKALLDDKAALIAVCLLSLSTAFITGTRHSILTSSIVPAVTMATLYFLLQWHRQGEKKFLYASFLLLGFGLTTRIWFVWFINALAVLAAFHWKALAPALSGPCPRVNGRDIAVSCGLFAAGAFPLVYYNVTTGFDTVRFVCGMLAKSNGGSVSYFDHLAKSWACLVELIKGKYLLGFPVGRTFFSLFGNGFYPVTLIAAALWATVTGFFSRGRFSRGKRFILLLSVLLFVQSAVPCFRLFPHHLFVLLPFLAAMTGSMINDLLSACRNRYVRALGLLLLLMLPLTDIVIMGNSHWCSAKMGYEGHESGASDRLVAWLESNDYLNPVALEPHTTTLLMLSPGTLRPAGVIYDEELSYGDFCGKFRAQLNDNRTVYIVYRNKSETFYSRFLERNAAETGRNLREIKAFWQPDGNVVYRVMRLEEERPQKRSIARFRSYPPSANKAC